MHTLLRQGFGGLRNFEKLRKKNWLRPTFPVLRFGASIIGADLFQDSVRNGKSWFQVAQVTRAPIITSLVHGCKGFVIINGRCQKQQILLNQ